MEIPSLVAQAEPASADCPPSREFWVGVLQLFSVQQESSESSLLWHRMNSDQVLQIPSAVGTYQKENVPPKKLRKWLHVCNEMTVQWLATYYFLIKRLSFSKHFVYSLRKPNDTGITDPILQRSTLRPREVVWPVPKPQRWGILALGLTHSFSWKYLLHSPFCHKMAILNLVLYLRTSDAEWRDYFGGLLLLKRTWNAFAKKGQ